MTPLIKPRVLAVTCAIGAVAAIASLIGAQITGTASPGSIAAFGGLAAMLIVLSLLYATRPQWGEQLGVAAAFGYALWQSLWIYLSSSNAVAGETLLALARSGPWTLMPHVVAFVLCAPRIALRISLSALAFMTISIVNAMMIAWPSSIDQAIHLGSNQLATQAMVIAVLGALARVRNRLSDRHASLDALLAQARTDALTGLANRQAFATAFARATQTRRADDPPHGPLALIIVDLDHFKHVNDTHGHLIGDRALVEAAGILRAQTDSDAALCRWGGEEFAILFTGVDATSIHARAEDVRQALANAQWPAGLKLTASLGVTPVVPGETLEDALQRADSALYAAKHQGRNRTVVAPLASVPVEPRADGATMPETAAPDQGAALSVGLDHGEAAAIITSLPGLSVPGADQESLGLVEGRRAGDLERRRGRTIGTLLLGGAGLFLLILVANRNYGRAPQELALMWAAMLACCVGGLWTLRNPLGYRVTGEAGLVAFTFYMLSIMAMVLGTKEPVINVLQMSIGLTWISAIMVAAPLLTRPSVARFLEFVAPIGAAVLVLDNIDFGAGRLGQRAISIVISALICMAMLSVLSFVVRRLLGLHRELVEATMTLSRAAMRDPLTGLLNRRGMEPLVMRTLAELSSHPRQASGASLTLIDLDHFKAINDLHGHLTGDEVLRDAAERIQRSLRPQDAAARWGGEEMLILSRDATLDDTLDRIAHLRSLMRAGDWPAELQVTASFGVTPLVVGDTLAEAIGRADAALYRAKAAGRNRIEIADVRPQAATA